MSIRDSSLKELHALAQQRLGPRAAKLKTRRELIDALEALEARQRRRAPPLPPATAVVAAAVPGPAPTAPALPPEPMIWTGEAPIPQITDPQAAAPQKLPAEVSNHFFLEPDQARLPASYGDDRVLTFARDPNALYAAWDFSASRFDQGAATGQVVDEEGTALRTFSIAGPAGSAFVEQLPTGVALKVEVRREAAVLGDSGWVVLGAGPARLPGPSPQRTPGLPAAVDPPALPDSGAGPAVPQRPPPGSSFIR